MASLGEIGHLFLSIFQKCPEKFARTLYEKRVVTKMLSNMIQNKIFDCINF
jgi:hypothetical protein